MANGDPPGAAAAGAEERAAYSVLLAVSVSHLLNDTIQSLLPAVYPILQQTFSLNFAQVGLMTLALMLTASVLQPLVGLYTDRRPAPQALAIGMAFSLAGLLVLASAWTFGMLIGAAVLVGIGSSVFHPESSRVARMASGGRHGMAQSVFQVGGNAGSALGPLVGAFLVAPHGQASIALCGFLAIAGIAIVWRVGRWSARHHSRTATASRLSSVLTPHLTRRRAIGSLAILAALIFSKYFYLASLTSYYTFYLITTFGTSVQTAQMYLFIFLGAVAAGTVLGGPIGDRVGRRPVIMASIFGILPFTLALPYANLFWTSVLTVIIGLMLASAFSAIVVYAQDLVPGRIGLISGIFFGFAFGMGGLGAAALGELADRVGIVSVYRLCAFLPAIGALGILLPDVEAATRSHAMAAAAAGAPGVGTEMAGPER